MVGTFKMMFYNNVLKKGSIQSEAQAGEYSIIHKHKLIIPNFSLLLIHVFETLLSLPQKLFFSAGTNDNNTLSDHRPALTGVLIDDINCS